MRVLTRCPVQCAVLLLALPLLIVMHSEWFMRHREAIITVSRLAAAAAAPVWLRQGLLTTAPGYSGGWLSRFPLLFLTVRMPLHIALSVASFLRFGRRCCARLRHDAFRLYIIVGGLLPAAATRDVAQRGGLAVITAVITALGPPRYNA